MGAAPRANAVAAQFWSMDNLEFHVSRPRAGLADALSRRLKASTMPMSGLMPLRPQAQASAGSVRRGSLSGYPRCEIGRVL